MKTSQAGTKARRSTSKAAVSSKPEAKARQKSSEAHEITLKSLLLWKLNMQHQFEAEVEGTNEVSLTLGIGAFQPAPKQYGVDFSVETGGKAELKFEVAYRAIFEIDFKNDDDELNKQALRSIYAHLIPSILYPYVRETIASTASKAGEPGYILPVINMQNWIERDEIDLSEFE